MSVLLEYAMFPTDKGESVSSYVSKIIEMIRNSGYPYKLTAMGTIIETDTLTEALNIIDKSYIILEPYANRIYASIKLDIRKNKNDRLKTKIEAIENKIGKVEK
jgi:uncharacterized protein (TIGR00106 family)